MSFEIVKDIPVFEKSKFTSAGIIGEGAYGKVYVVEHPHSGRMAFKQFPSVKAGEAVNQERLRELESIAKHTRHQNIIQFFGYVTEEINGILQVVGYAMEYMADKALSDVIYDPKIYYQPADVACWGRQAALALSWLHSRNTIHRDVKPPNMLLSDGRRILKLCDFGTTRTTAEPGTSMTLGVGTLVYMAPELLNLDQDRDKYTEKCDVYSMGILLWETLAIQIPYGELKMDMIDMCKHVTNGERPPLDEIEDAPFQEIIRLCFSSDPKDRPTMEKIEADLKNLESTLSRRTHLCGKVEETSQNTNSTDGSEGVDALRSSGRNLEVQRSSLIKPLDSISRATTQYTIASNSKLPIFGHKLGMLRRRSKLVRTFLWNPQEDLLATSTTDYNVRIWDFRDMEIVLNEKVAEHASLLLDHCCPYKKMSISQYVPVLDWNSCGSRLATATRDGDVRIWDSEGRLECKMKCHDWEIWAMRWSPDDKHILSCGDDKSCVVMNVEQGILVHRFNFHSEAVIDVAWTSNDSFLSCSDDKTINLCQIGQYQAIRTYTDHQGGIYVIKFDPISKMFATRSNDKTIRIWLPTADKALHVWTDRSEHTWDIEWSPRGYILASMFGGRTIRFWDARDGSLVRSFSHPSDDLKSMCWSPDGRFVVTSDMKISIHIWNAETGKMLVTYTGKNELEVNFLKTIKWNHCGDILAAEHRGGPTLISTPVESFLVDCSTPLLKQIEFLGDFNKRTLKNFGMLNPKTKSRSTEETMIATNRSIEKIINLDGLQVVVLSCDGMGPPECAWNPQHDLLVSCDGADSAKILYLSDGEEATPNPQEPRSQLLKHKSSKQEGIRVSGWNRNGSLLATLDYGQTVYIWSNDGSHLHSMFDCETTAVVWNPDRDQILLAGHGSAAVWNVNEKESVLVHTFSFKPSVMVYVAWTSGKSFVCSSGNSLPEFNISSSEPTNRYFLSQERVELRLAWITKGFVHSPIGHDTKNMDSLIFDPVGQLLAASYPSRKDGKIYIWLLKEDEPKFDLSCDAVREIQWSPLGHILASCSEDCTVKLWDARIGQVVRTLTGHTAGVLTVGFSPEGTLIASGDRCGTIFIWDIEKDHAIATNEGSKNVVNDLISDVRWNRKGNKLMTSQTGCIRVIDLSIIR